MGTRLQQLEAMLAARTTGDKPVKGFKRNVDALKAEISRLKTKPNLVGGSGG